MLHRLVILIALLMTVSLSGYQPRLMPEPEAFLDDTIMLELMADMKKSIRAGNRLRWQGVFAKDVQVEYISPDGVRKVSDLESFTKMMDEYMTYGRGYDLQILDQFVIVSEDKQRAMVKRTSKEVWMFDEKYEDVSSEIDHYMEWELIDGVPQITKMVRQYNTRSVLSRKGEGSIAPMWTGDIGLTKHTLFNQQQSASGHGRNACQIKC